jgi:hypothetical protein
MPGRDIPEIMWGTFYGYDETIHVAPVIGGYLMEGHTLKDRCFCFPDIEYTDIKKVKMVIHHVVH